MPRARKSNADFNHRSRRRLGAPAQPRFSCGNIESYDLSPKGERALFSARGDIFTAPIEKGPTRNLTHSSGAHDKWPSWSPDGSQIAFISDMSGEEELYVDSAGRLEAAEQITSGGSAMRYQPEWSPDGKRIAFSDKDGKIYVVTLADQKMIEIADAPRGQIRDYVWSPRGNYLAFSMASTGNRLFVRCMSGARRTAKCSRVTDDMFNAYNPAWDPQGNYLYFLSDREFAPQISQVEFNYATNRRLLHLRDGFAQGRQASVPAGKRRSNGRQGRMTKPKPAAKTSRGETS